MRTRARQPAGVPVGGQFAARAHAEAELTLVDPASEPVPAPPPAEEAPPLQNYRVVGFVRKAYSPAPGINQPGGTCWHCGAGIINCVQARHIETGEVIDVGMDCAERTGLDKAALKKMLREKFAEERADRRRRQSAEERARLEAEEAEATEKFGEHGTEGRYGNGKCRCGECLSAAPHGTLDRLEHTDCYCEACVEAAVDSGRYRIQERNVLIDAATGRQIPNSRAVSTRYGMRWVVDTDNGPEWYPYGRKRRSTMADRGLLEAPVQTLLRVGRHNDYPVSALEEPTVDAWGEPIVVSDDSD